MKRIFTYITYIFICLLSPALLVQEKASAQSLSLEDCLRMAGENDVRIRNAGLDVIASRAQKSEALSNWFPTVSIDGTGFYAFDPFLKIRLGDVLGDSDYALELNRIAESAGALYGISTSWTALDYGFSARAQLTQLLYAGGRIVNGNRLAALGVEAAMLKESLAVRESSDEIADKYWRVVSLEDKMLTLGQAVSMIDTLHRDVLNACSAGLALDTDTLKVVRERNGLMLQKARLESGIRLARMDLFNAIGQPYSTLRQAASPQRPYLGDILFSDSAGGLLSPENYYVDEQSAASLTQESRLLDLSVRSARLERKMTVGEALPQIGVGVSYGYGRIYGSPEWNGGVFASVKIPLTDWWKTSAKAKRCDVKIEKAQNESDRLNEQLVLKIRDLWEKVVLAWQEVDIAEEAVAIDLLNESRTRDLFDSGQATVSEVLESQTALRKSRGELTDAEISYRLAVSRYLRAACAR